MQCKSLIAKIKESSANVWYGTGAALTVLAMSNPAMADANTGIANLYTGTWKEQLKSVSKVVTAGSFVAGIILIAGGLMKLKAAVDSQGQQVKYGDGLWRLALGSALCALPVIAGVGSGTMVGSTASGLGDGLMDGDFKVESK